MPRDGGSIQDAVLSAGMFYPLARTAWAHLRAVTCNLHFQSTQGIITKTDLCGLNTSTDVALILLQQSSLLFPSVLCNFFVSFPMSLGRKKRRLGVLLQLLQFMVSFKPIKFGFSKCQTCSAPRLWLRPARKWRGHKEASSENMVIMKDASWGGT